MTEKTLTIPIYDFIVNVIIADTDAELDKALTESGHNVGIENGGMIVLQAGDRVYTLGILRDSISPGNIAHEAGHLTNRIWHGIGAGLHYKDDEPFQYLLGFITDGIHQIIEHEDRS